jgi:hypothetical protein
MARATPELSPNRKSLPVVSPSYLVVFVGWVIFVFFVRSNFASLIFATPNAGTVLECVEGIEARNWASVKWISYRY